MELKAELTPEEKLWWANVWYLNILHRINEALEKKLGEEEAKSILGKVYYQVGKEDALKVRDVLGIDGGTPADYARVHNYQDTNFWGIEEDVSIDEKGRAVIRASSCPANGVYQHKDCAMLVGYVKGMFEVINPNLKWEAPRCLTKGDDCCEFIVSEKDV